METLKKDPFAVIPEVVIGNPFSLRTTTWIPACQTVSQFARRFIIDGITSKKEKWTIGI
jgi:hypothetical protein